MSTRAYHLHELEIARSQEDSRRVMPEIRPQHRRVLDLGCGAGQTLIASDLPAGTWAAGVDVDFDALLLGQELAAPLAFVNGLAEGLPFADAVFDLVIARVVLPFVRIRPALAEIGRVLRPGGDLWMLVHPPRRAWRSLRAAAGARNGQGALHQGYVLANGALFHLIGEVAPSPASGRYESFQTAHAMIRELRRVRLNDVIVVRARHHTVMTAVKR
ncbi:MAG: class I SAM-dependent methyltransferase [Caldilineales bacterium]